MGQNRSPSPIAQPRPSNIHYLTTVLAADPKPVYYNLTTSGQLSQSLALISVFSITHSPHFIPLTNLHSYLYIHPHLANVRSYQVAALHFAPPFYPTNGIGKKEQQPATELVSPPPPFRKRKTKEQPIEHSLLLLPEKGEGGV